VVLNLGLDFHDHLSAADVERTTAELAADIRTRRPMIREIFIQAREPRDGVKS